MNYKLLSRFNSKRSGIKAKRQSEIFHYTTLPPHKFFTIFSAIMRQSLLAMTETVNY